MDGSKTPVWIVSVLGVMALLMFAGTTPAFYNQIVLVLGGSGQTLSFPEELYNEFSLSAAAKQLAVVIIVVFALIKRDVRHVYLVSLLLLVLNVFTLAVLSRYGNSFNLWLAAVFAIASGACFAKLRYLQGNA